MRLTKILKIKGGWAEVVDDCRATVGKGELGKEPSRSFKRRILIAEHSPIRDISVRWCWLNIKSWIATHWVRHVWSCFVSTQREDRTGIDRDELPQAALVNFRGEANVQHLIDTWRKRLCRTAHPQTRAYAEDFKRELREYEPEISDVLVPHCVYRGFCQELHTCGFWSKFCENLTKEELISWETRYAKYNELFAKSQSDR